MDKVVIYDTFCHLREMDLSLDTSTVGMTIVHAWRDDFDEAAKDLFFALKSKIQESEQGPSIRIYDGTHLYSRLEVILELAARRENGIRVLISFDLAPGVASPKPIELHMKSGSTNPYGFFSAFNQAKAKSCKDFRRTPEGHRQRFKVIATGHACKPD